MLILQKCAFNYSPDATVFFEKKTVGWLVKVVLASKVVELFFNSEQPPTMDEVKYFIETASKVKVK